MKKKAVVVPMIDKLQGLWLEQLSREFRDICFQYRLDLQPPILELSNAARQLGCWLPAQRTIRISRRLILEHPWQTVLMVFKHEMAHQLCSELFGRQQTGHDRHFRQACQMLGVPPPYNRSSGDLTTVLCLPPEDRQTAAGRRMISRVHKLLALAASDNEHEAALAMQRATELLQRHNLDPAAAAAPSACSRLIINTRSRQIPSFRRTICAILGDYFFVQVICSSTYDPQSNSSFKTIELLGRAENVPVAEHCYHFLEQQLAALWQKNRSRFHGNARTAKKSYYLGLLHGFAEKLALGDKNNRQEREDMPQEAAAGALAVSRDSSLQDFVSCHFPRLRKHSARGIRIYSQPYTEAVDTGRTIVLHQSLADKKQGLQGLLRE